MPGPSFDRDRPRLWWPLGPLRKEPRQRNALKCSREKGSWSDSRSSGELVTSSAGKDAHYRTRWCSGRSEAKGGASRGWRWEGTGFPARKELGLAARAEGSW